MNSSNSPIISAHEASLIAENVGLERITRFIKAKAARGKVRLMVKVGETRKVNEYEDDNGKQRERLCIHHSDLSLLGTLNYKITATGGDGKTPTDLYFVDWSFRKGSS